jgi:hypothetical protein
MLVLFIFPSVLIDEGNCHVARKKSKAQFGKLPPKYKFILNPYQDVRFSSCLRCSGKTLIRKVPLFVHVYPEHPTTINKRCRYCPKCDLLIVHQDELETSLVLSHREDRPEIVGNEYLVLGTLSPSAWRKRNKEPLNMGNAQENVHDFKERFDIKPAYR